MLAKRFLLVSVFDPNALVCAGQNRDVWANPDISTLVKEQLLFLQLRDSSKEGREFAQIYPRQGEWPHLALVDPRTGENLKQWEGKDAQNAEILLEQISQLLSRHSNEHFGGRIQKKRRFEQILDKTEDEQIAIAIAASIKGEKSKAKKRREDQLDESDDGDDEPPIDNSDFESVDGDSEDNDEFDRDASDENCQGEKVATPAAQCASSTAASNSLPVVSPAAKNIAIVVRTPKHEKLRYELRSCVDCSVLREMIESDGYPLDSFELVRAYPKEKIDLTRGKTLGIMDQLEI